MQETFKFIRNPLKWQETFACHGSVLTVYSFMFSNFVKKNVAAEFKKDLFKFCFVMVHLVFLLPSSSDSNSSTMSSSSSEDSNSTSELLTTKESTSKSSIWLKPNYLSDLMIIFLREIMFAYHYRRKIKVLISGLNLSFIGSNAGTIYSKQCRYS
jgi:hypothetical protein